ncbi:ABC transporter substrate-binding protein [Streptomyces sp. TRM66268-LWL]|uniref:ABC transporter substrate-binding protein n=1 Tax=Streptomyces polyasparticus TaxID=2767826 RepID=A0ABR7SQ10_9ACTN|nr:ABC transporter substrate-binding protein [Streptomyces polyasparticus]MBC9716999.1 ABC transporter substrate-binding protein [Streptomyces polyasparticus]
MSKSRLPQLSRRGLLAAGGAAGLGALLVACGDDKGSKKDGGSTQAADSGPFSFTDDRGTAVKADKIPANIVAFTGTAAALYDYGIQVKGVFGPTKTADGKPDVQAGDMDISKVEILGNAWDKFSVEQYAALNPDLLVTDMWIKDQGWYISGTGAEKKILQLKVPSVYLWAAETTMDKALARRVDLAKALGADTSAKKVTDAKAAFEKAAARLRAATKANPGIKVMVGSGSADLFYVTLPKTAADTAYFESLGVEFVQPKVNAQGFFEELSWENVDKYKADVIMMDNRTGTLQPADLDKSKPTWKQLPAVKAGQVIPRVTEPIYSYAKCTPILEDLAKAIEDAKKVAK